MTTFQIEKGSKFQIDKGIKKIQVELGWKAEEGVDLDGSVFGLVHLQNGAPVFYGDGSHAICYANKEAKNPDKTLASPDKAITHSGDSRSGGDGVKPDEVIVVDFERLPAEIVEIAVWITIYKAGERKHDFGHVHKSFFRIVDQDVPGAPLAQYDLGKEFSTSTAVQVGSFTKNSAGNWEFTALGAGSTAELGLILQQYS